MEPHGGSGKILRIFSRRKMKADNPLGPSQFRWCTWSSIRALTGGTIKIETSFFERREAINHWRGLLYERFSIASW